MRSKADRDMHSFLTGPKPPLGHRRDPVKDSQQAILRQAREHCVMSTADEGRPRTGSCAAAISAATAAAAACARCWFSQSADRMRCSRPSSSWLQQYLHPKPLRFAHCRRPQAPPAAGAMMPPAQRRPGLASNACCSMHTQAFAVNSAVDPPKTHSTEVPVLVPTAESCGHENVPRPELRT